MVPAFFSTFLSVIIVPLNYLRMNRNNENIK